MKKETKKASGQFSVLKIDQLSKNSDYLLDNSDLNTSKILKIIKKYGNIYPVIAVKNDRSDTYTIIKGQNIVKIASELNLIEVNAIVINYMNKIDSQTSSLIMSTINDNLGPLAQGALIEELLTSGNLSLTDLSKTVGKSKSWLSKRVSLKQDLSDTVKSLVQNNTLRSRTAEEIAKLPKQEQDKFAKSVIDTNMTKDLVSKLVGLYNDKSTSDEKKKRIIEDPTSINLMPETVPNKKKAININDNEEIIQYTMNNVKKITQFFELNFNKNLSKEYLDQIKLLSKYTDILNSTVLNLVESVKCPGVSPGKRLLS
jgi:ParB family chromosome partitioning protein